MKSIFHIFTGKEIDYAIHLTPRKKSGNIPSGEDPYEPLMRRYVSRVGSQSLIFNPTVALYITQKSNTQNYAVIPYQLIYQYANLLRSVYDQIRENPKLFIQDPGGAGLIMASNEAAKVTRKLSIYKSMLIIAPDYFTDMNTGSIEYAIRIQIDRNVIGIMRETEALAFINTIQRMDITTYALLVGLTNQVMEMDEKLDRILQKLNES